jgi:hypothetical protein
MKRNFTLIRDILSDAQKAEPLSHLRGFSSEGVSEAEIAEHVEILIEAGLLKGEVKRSPGGRTLVLVSRLTWAGHDFLDAMGDESIWARAKESILKPAGGVAFDVLLDWLKWQAKKQLGMPDA